MNGEMKHINREALQCKIRTVGHTHCKHQTVIDIDMENLGQWDIRIVNTKLSSDIDVLFWMCSVG